MIFSWENKQDRVKRHMKISSEKKLELLYQMRAFTEKYTPKKNQKIRSILKKSK